MTRGRKPDDYYLHEGRTVPVFWPVWTDIEPASDLEALTATDVEDTDILILWDSSAGAYKKITVAAFIDALTG